MSPEHFRKTGDILSNHIKESLSQINEEDAMKMVDMILSANRIFVYGVGRSGLVGKAFAMRLVQMGIETFFIGETITPLVEKGDMVILLSNTGATMSAIQTANIVGRVGGSVAVITANPNSKLAHTANMILLIPVKNGEHKQHSPLGTKFEEATMVALDALIAVIMKKTGETETTMRARHAILV